MYAVRAKGAEVTYKGFAPDMADLPCDREEPGVIVCHYQFTDEEKTMIANGAGIRFVVFSEPIPPTAHSVEKVEEEWQEDDLRCQNTSCRSVWKKERGYTACGHCGGDLKPATETAA